MKVGAIFKGPDGRRYEVLGPGEKPGTVCTRALWGFGREDDRVGADMTEANGWRVESKGTGGNVRGVERT